MGETDPVLRSQLEMVERARRFVERAKRLVDVVEVYVVGSRARGDYLVDSDIDLVLVVRGVEGLNMRERLELLTDVAEPGVEYLIYTPEEWEGGATLWIRELRREARRLEELGGQ